MLETIIAGQSMMIPIMACSVWALAVLADRAWAFYQNSKIDTRALRAQVMSCLRKGQIKEALLLCANTPGPVAAVILAGLQAYAKMEKKTPENLRATITEAMDGFSVHSMSAVEKRMWVLTVVGNAAPLFGMCGTVTGMIRSFNALAAQGIDAAAVGVGIAEALITTAAGLIIALFSVIPYSYFASLAEKIQLDIYEATAEMVEFFTTEAERAASGA